MLLSVSLNVSKDSKFNISNGQVNLVANSSNYINADSLNQGIKMSISTDKLRFISDSTGTVSIGGELDGQFINFVLKIK